MAGEVSLFDGHVGWAYCDELVLLHCAGATMVDAVRANTRSPADVARRDMCGSRVRPAALVIANDMTAAQN